MKSETLLSTLFANWARCFNVFEKARFIENLRKKYFGIWTTLADQTRLARARATVSALRGSFTAKLPIMWLLTRSPAS